jgi:hypothetical protein
MRWNQIEREKISQVVIEEFIWVSVVKESEICARLEDILMKR